MMKRTQIKDIVRNIRTNAVSWLAVVIVVTITCGVYCGVFFYADTMEDTAAEFFERTNFEDLTVTTAAGATEEDVRQLRDLPGVLDAEGTYRLGGVTLQYERQSHTADLHAVTGRISVPELLDGALPESGMECAVTADAMELYGISVGNRVNMTLGGEPLAFTVTGVVKHPYAYFQSQPLCVFVPASTMEMLSGINRFPYVLIDASCGGSLFSGTYNEELSAVRADVRAAMEEKDAAREENDPAKTEGFVLTARMDYKSFMALRQIVDILRKLSTIFIVIFVVIGAIVVTSTITVVIDGQKRQIGFLKAYGFRNSEIIRRYLVYGESAVLAGMLCTTGVAFLLQLVIRNVLEGMFCLEVNRFAFRLVPYFLLLLMEAVLCGVITTRVTVSNASRYSAVELLSWSGTASNNPKRRRSAEKPETAREGSLYSRLIFRNIRSDKVRVIASTIIIAGCCFMIGIGITLRSAFYSMTENTRREVALYDLECTLSGEGNIGELENAVLGSGASCARAVKTQTVYGFEDFEEYVTVVTAGTDVFQDYLRMTGTDGKTVPVPDTGCALIQNRISERLGIADGDKIVIYDGALNARPVRVSAAVRNYLGRVIYLSEETYASVFGFEPEANTLLVRLGGADAKALADSLTERFPGAEISYTDSMPGVFSGLTKAFNALIYVLITLSVIMSVFVLLNLVNIFVSRRKNELIIMGINGFSYREELGYLLRETIATTAAGLIFGVLFGAAVTKPIVKIIEAADTMCARSVNWGAWAAGMAAEAAFALLIDLYAFRRVRHFSMKDLK